MANSIKHKNEMKLKWTDKVEVSRQTLYNIFKARDAIKLLKEWTDLDEEQIASRFFDLIVEHNG